MLGLSDLVVFNVRSQVATEVIALFKIDAGHEPGGKSFHYFSASHPQTLAQQGL
jgi:hypothetical protein